MKTLRTWNNDDLDLIEGEIAKQGERIELTHWKAWDNIFGGIERGSIYMIASTTGGGKSTLLLAMAKHMARQYPNKRIMYITIEQNIRQIYKFLDARNIPNMCIVELESLKEWAQIVEYIGEYDYLFYDYLGALSEGTEDEWINLREDAKTLANIAKTYDVPIITAAQARNELLEDYAAQKVQQNVKYLSFSKAMANLIAGGVYWVPQPGRSYGFFYNFKNRYQELHIGGEKINVDYRTKELKDSAA